MVRQYLIVRLFRRLSTGEQLVQLFNRPFFVGRLAPADVATLLAPHGFLLAGFGDPLVGRLGAVAYLSPNQNGRGRGGSQVWRFRISRADPEAADFENPVGRSDAGGRFPERGGGGDE